MKRGLLTLNNPEKYSVVPQISKEKITRAIERATTKLADMGKKHGITFPAGRGPAGLRHTYGWGDNCKWVHGMYAGSYWLSYQLTGDNFFKDMAIDLTRTFRERFDQNVDMDYHDVGFCFSPSCVAGYKLTGDLAMKQNALDAVDYFYHTSYSHKGKFIIRSWKSWKIKRNPEGCRTMMDSLLNAPLLFWAGEETGDQKYFQAAHDHINTIEKYLVREDGSSYHHYQFDPITEEPVRGLTWQGFRDESCWSRGQSWGIAGFPIAYKYDPSEVIKGVHHDLTYFMLNHLPEDMIPYYDYDFMSGNEAPRDSSAAVIGACGMLEMAKNFKNDDPDKTVYNSAAAQLIEAVIDRCTDEITDEYEGLICHVTGNLPLGMGIDSVGVYADYFYLEALARYTLPDFEMYW